MKTKLANVALAVMLALTATHHSAAQAPASPASASAIAVSDQADADGADHGREAGRGPVVCRGTARHSLFKHCSPSTA